MARRPASVIEAFQATGTLADCWLLWAGDGRITAGHLAVLAERAAAGPVQVVLFDGTIGAGWSWSDRDEAMAGRILAAALPGNRMLVVAGNAHTPTGRTELGVPMGPGWPASGRGAGNPHQLRRRTLLQHATVRVRPARRSGPADAASPRTRNARARSACSGRGGRPPPVWALAAPAYRTLTAADPDAPSANGPATRAPRLGAEPVRNREAPQCGRA